jgi:hypothetical protein
MGNHRQVRFQTIRDLSTGSFGQAGNNILMGLGRYAISDLEISRVTR